MFFSGTYWKRVVESFVVAFGAVFLAQFAQIQSAVSAGDWGAAKKAGLAVLAAAAVAIVKALWLAVVAQTGGGAALKKGGAGV